MLTTLDQNSQACSPLNTHWGDRKKTTTVRKRAVCQLILLRFHFKMDPKKARASFECWKIRMKKETYGMNMWQEEGKSRRRHQWAVKRQIQVCAFETHTVKYQATAAAAAHVFTHVVSNLSLKQLLLLFQMNRIKHSRLVFLKRRLKANRVQFFSSFWCEYLLCQSISSYLVWRSFLHFKKRRNELNSMGCHSQMAKLETVFLSCTYLKHEPLNYDTTDSLQNTDQC